MYNMRGDIWDYFEKCEDGDEKLAKCRFCAKLYNYQSTIHNLKSHLNTKHKDIDEIEFSDRKHNVTTTLTTRNSELWEHFTVIDYEDKTAKCNYCQKSLCYKTTVTNLKSHLKRIHVEAYNAFIESDSALQNVAEKIYLENYDDSNISTKDNVATDIWGYFERETGGRARCSICRERIPQRLSHLKNHMNEKHPKLMLEIYQDSDNASANETEDQNDNTYTEVVYLSDGYNNSKIKQEDRDLRSPRKPLSRREISQRRHRIAERKKRKHSSSSEEFQDKRRKMIDDEEIDKFGVYITCLLKKVPRNVCMKLQMDIVNLVMNANLNNVQKEEQKPESTVENKIIVNGVPVTIQTVSSSPGAGYVLTVPNNVDGVKKEAVIKTALSAVVNEKIHEDDEVHDDNSENVKSHMTVTTQSVNAGHCTVSNVISNFTDND